MNSVRAYKIIFAVLEGRLIQTDNKWPPVKSAPGRPSLAVNC